MREARNATIPTEGPPRIVDFAHKQWLVSLLWRPTARNSKLIVCVQNQQCRYGPLESISLCHMGNLLCVLHPTSENDAHLCTLSAYVCRLRSCPSGPSSVLQRKCSRVLPLTFLIVFATICDCYIVLPITLYYTFKFKFTITRDCTKMPKILCKKNIVLLYTMGKKQCATNPSAPPLSGRLLLVRIKRPAEIPVYVNLNPISPKCDYWLNFSAEFVYCSLLWHRQSSTGSVKVSIS